MHAVVFYYDADNWYVNVWEHPGFGAKLVATCERRLHSRVEALDWLYNDSGYHIESKEIRDYPPA
jgi:hypothetical protein